MPTSLRPAPVHKTSTTRPITSTIPSNIFNHQLTRSLFHRFHQGKTFGPFGFLLLLISVPSSVDRSSGWCGTDVHLHKPPSPPLGYLLATIANATRLRCASSLPSASSAIARSAPA